MRRYATRTAGYRFPALKGRAKFTPTLRVEVFRSAHSKKLDSKQLEQLTSKHHHYRAAY